MVAPPATGAAFLPVEVVSAKATTAPALETVARLARERGTEVPKSDRVRFRRSFRLGCAERLVERIESRRGRVARGAYDGSTREHAARPRAAL
jgi:hypothetical protein